jgi:hypothetical protein
MGKLDGQSPLIQSAIGDMKLGIPVLLLGTLLASRTESRGQAHPHPDDHATGETWSDFEIDFAASDIFRTGSYIQPVWRRWGFEGHYFSEEGTHVGFTGASYLLRIGELKVLPGFGVVFGSGGFATAPAGTLRWDFERSWFVTQGLFLQGLRETKPPVEEAEHGHGEHAGEVDAFHVSISDGSHISARWGRITVGGTWEHIHFREGNEWKGGGRVAFRILPRVSGVLFVFGPGRAELRGGIMIHPPETH